MHTPWKELRPVVLLYSQSCFGHLYTFVGLARFDGGPSILYEAGESRWRCTC